MEPGGRLSQEDFLSSCGVCEEDMHTQFYTLRITIQWFTSHLNPSIDAGKGPLIKGKREAVTPKKEGKR